MPEALTILQVCRRFGPVGGMERYVWELCRELARMGHCVHVLCETNFCTEPLLGVNVHALGAVRPKPRWLAHIRFSQHVHTWLQENRTHHMIVHSHERIEEHHITTFHGPPFAVVRDLALWKRFSLRVQMNLWLEKRELCNPQVQVIVPNSSLISQQLEHYYPAIRERLSTPIVPGVAVRAKRPQRLLESDAGVIGFVGKEWKRKGLKKAIDIISKLATKRSKLHFMVAGPVQKDIQQLFHSANFSFTLLGEVNTQYFYPQLDVLLHPASSEPYGMVITEALSAGVPVVISDVCGAISEVTVERGSVVALEAPIVAWCDAIELWLSRSDVNIHYEYSWYQAALAYEAYYKKIAF